MAARSAAITLLGFDCQGLLYTNTQNGVAILGVGISTVICCTHPEAVTM